MERLCCGTAKKLITPPADLMPDLYGLMRSRFAGVIDDLHVRVAIIANGTDRAMFVSWELDKAPVAEIIIPKLSQLTDIPSDHILYFAVHTHTAPLHSAREGDGPNARAKQSPEVQEATRTYEMLLEKAVLAAASEALSNMQPVRLGWSTSESYVGEHRIQDYYVEQENKMIEKIAALGSNPTKNIDRTLFLMRAEKEDGTPVCFFINHAVHSCVMIMNNFNGYGGVGISADLAGQVSSLLEEKYPGCVALWSSGAAGDINPVMMNQYNYADPMTGAPSEYRNYKTPEPAKLMLLTLSRRQFADVMSANRELVCDIENADISGEHTIISTPSEEGPSKQYQVRLQAIKLGDMLFCGASGELFDSLGKAIKNISGSDATVVINHDRSLLVESGYIIDDEGFARCTRSDGSRDGIPGIRNTVLRPGYIKQALEHGAEELFKKLKS